MSYHEGSNWQAKKEDENKPLYDKLSKEDLAEVAKIEIRSNREYEKYCQQLEKEIAELKNKLNKEVTTADGDKSELSEEWIENILIDNGRNYFGPKERAKAIYQAISPIIEENKELRETKDVLTENLLNWRKDIEGIVTEPLEKRITELTKENADLKKTISGYQTMIDNMNKEKMKNPTIPPPEVK